MQEALITFETAKLAKEKGFGKTLEHIYPNSYKIVGINQYVKVLNSQNNTIDNFISAPSQSQLQKWLREVHNLHLIIVSVMNSDEYEVSIVKQPGHVLTSIDDRDTYENILEKALKTALNLIPTP